MAVGSFQLPRAAARSAPPPRGAWGLRAIAFGYLGLLLVLPLSVVVQNSLGDGLGGLWADIARPAAWAALKLTLWTSGVMTVMNTLMGTLTAYVLVRYQFPGRGLINAILDLPFAIPTLVTGLMLVLLYGPQGALGGWLKAQWGWDIIFAPPGIILALLFVSLPYVVRTLQPVLMSIELDQEEAAQTIGASAWTTFRRVLLPALTPAISTGAMLSFARALGEFGAIVIVAGNVPLRSQTAAVYVLSQIESENQRGASSMSLVLLAIAFTLMLAADLWQRRLEAKHA